MSSPIRSDRSFDADALPKDLPLARLSAKLELPDSSRPTIVQTPRSGKAPLDRLARYA
jgi:hypothetical protein